MSEAASRMSVRSFKVSGGIHQHAVPVGHEGEVRISNGVRLHQVDRPPQQVFQRELKAHVSLERPLPAQLLKLDKKVQIAAKRVCLTAGGGAEQFKPSHLVRPAKTLN